MKKLTILALLIFTGSLFFTSCSRKTCRGWYGNGYLGYETQVSDISAKDCIVFSDCEFG